jgi:hypothetical protein
MRRFFSDRTRGLIREHVFGLEYTVPVPPEKWYDANVES